MDNFFISPDELLGRKTNTSDPFSETEQGEQDSFFMGPEEFPEFGQPQPMDQQQLQIPLMQEGEDIRTVDGRTMVRVPEQFRKYRSQPFDRGEYFEKIRPLMTKFEDVQSKFLTGKSQVEREEEQDSNTFVGGLQRAYDQGRDLAMPIINQFMANPRELLPTEGPGSVVRAVVEPVLDFIGAPKNENPSSYLKLEDAMSDDGYVSADDVVRLEIPRQEIAKMMARVKEAQTGIPAETLLRFSKLRGLGDPSVDWDEKVASIKEQMLEKGIELSDREAFEIATQPKHSESLSIDDTYDEGTVQNFFDEALMQIPGSFVRRLRKDDVLGDYKEIDFVGALGLKGQLQTAISTANSTKESVEIPIRGQGGIYAGSVTVDPGDALEEIQDAFNDEYLSSNIADMEHLGGSSKIGLLANILTIPLIPVGGVIKGVGGAGKTVLTKVAPILSRVTGIAPKITVNPLLLKTASKIGETAATAGVMAGIGAAGAFEGQAAEFATGGAVLAAGTSGLGLAVGGIISGVGLAKGVIVEKLLGGAPRQSNIERVMAKAGEKGLTEAHLADTWQDLPLELQKRVSEQEFNAFKTDMTELKSLESQIRGTFARDDKAMAAINPEDFKQILASDTPEGIQMREMLDRYSLLTSGHTVTELRNKSALIDTLLTYKKSEDEILAVMRRYEELFKDSDTLVNAAKTELPELWDNLYNNIHSGTLNDRNAYYEAAMEVFRVPVTDTVEAIASTGHLYNQDLYRRLSDLEVSTRVKDELMSAASNRPATIEKAAQDLGDSAGEWFPKFQEKTIKYFGFETVEDIAELGMDSPVLLEEVIKRIRKSGTTVPKQLSQFVKRIKAENRVYQMAAGSYLKESVSKRMMRQAPGLDESGAAVFARTIEQRKPTRGAQIISEFASSKSPIATRSFISGMVDKMYKEAGTAKQMRESVMAASEVAHKFAKAIVTNSPVEVSKDTLKLLRKETATIIKDYNRDAYTLSKIRNAVSNETPLYALSYSQRAASTMTHPHLRKAALEEVGVILNAAAKELQELPIGPADMMRVAESIMLDPVQIYLRKDIPSYLADKTIIKNIAEASRSISRKMIDLYADSYKMRTGEDFDKLTFLAYFLKDSDGYASEIYGKALSERIGRFGDRSRKGKTLSFFMGAEYAGRSFSSLTGQSIQSAMTAKFNGEKYARKASAIVSEAYAKDIMKVAPAVREPGPAAAVWSRLGGVEGIRRFAGRFTEDGQWAKTSVGKTLEHVFVNTDTYSKILMRDDTEGSVKVLARMFDEDVVIRNAVMEEVTARGKRLGHKQETIQDAYKGRIDELAEQVYHYWNVPQATREDWITAFKAMSVDAKYRAKVFKDSNDIISNFNKEYVNMGVKVQPFRHRDDLCLSMLDKDALGIGVTRLGETNFIDGRWRRTVRSSTESQIERATRIPKNEVAHPEAAMMRYIYSKYHDAYTIHPNQYIEGTANLVEALGYSGAAHWARQWAGQTVQVSLANKLGVTIHGGVRALARNETIGPMFQIGANISNSIIVPGLKLARIATPAFQYLQGLSSYMSRTDFRSAAVAAGRAIPDFLFSTRAVLGPQKKFRLVPEDIIGLVGPSASLEEVKRKVIMAHMDEPINKSLDSFHTYTSATQLTKRNPLMQGAVKASNKLLDVSSTVSRELTMRLKENFEVAASRIAFDRGAVIYQNVLEMAKRIGENPEAFKSAIDLMTSTMGNLTRTEAVELLHSMMRMNKELGDDLAAAPAFLRTYHDGTIGRFGSNASSVGARVVGSVVPGASVFYSAKVQIPVQVAMGVANLAKNVIHPSRIRYAQVSAARDAWILASLAGLFYVESIVNTGVSSKVADTLGMDESNPVRLGVNKWGIDFAGTTSVGQTMKDVKRMGNKGIEGVYTTLVSSLVLGSPQSGDISRSALAFGTADYLHALTLASKVASTAIADMTSDTILGQLRNDFIASRFSYRDRLAKADTIADPELRMQELAKIEKDYRLEHTGYAGQALTEFFMRDSYGQILNQVVENPFLYFYLRSQYSQDDIMYQLMKSEEHTGIATTLDSMGFFPFNMSDTFGLRDFFGDPNMPDNEFIGHLDNMFAKWSAMGVVMVPEVKERIRESYARYVAAMDEPDNYAEQDELSTDFTGYTDPAFESLGK